MHELRFVVNFINRSCIPGKPGLFYKSLFIRAFVAISISFYFIRAYLENLASSKKAYLFVHSWQFLKNKKPPLIRTGIVTKPYINKNLQTGIC